MKTLYLASTKAYAGKTLLAIALAKDAQRRGKSVRYFKPIGPYPVMIDGIYTDTDAQRITQLIGVDAPLDLLCGVPMTEEFYSNLMKDQLPPLLPIVKEKFDKLSEGADLVLAGGVGALFSTGISYGLPSWDVADTLDAQVLVISRYKPDRTIDELLAAARQYNGRMVGAIINAVRPDILERVKTTVVPFLEKHGVAVFGVLPDDPVLFSVPANVIMEGLNARVICGQQYLSNLIERFVIGAMSAESALSHFRKITNKAVITGGDRGDIICAALETSLRALILTGGLEPDYRICSALCDHKVPVLLVREDTATTLERIDKLQENLRFRAPEKIERAQELVKKHIDLNRLWEKM